MFTGIIEARSRVIRVQRGKKGAELMLEKPRSFGKLKTGSSIAVNGVCLTVMRQARGHISFQVVAETLKRSNLSRLAKGDQVNLERALSARGRMEGHFVLGHVDGLGVVRDVRKRGLGADYRIDHPKALKPYILEKGSVSVDGVSLTLGKVGGGSFWIHAIPHTLRTTGMGAYRKGQSVNLEADILLKFLHKLMIS